MVLLLFHGFPAISNNAHKKISMKIEARNEKLRYIVTRTEILLVYTCVVNCAAVKH